MNKRGFTLVEVLTVIAIIGVLASITGYVYTSAVKNSRDQQRLSDLDTIQNSLEQYYMDHRSYPNRDSSLLDDDSNPSLVVNKILSKTIFPNYLAKLPTDPTFTSEISNYLYLPLAEMSKTNKVGYYLAAKVERKNNASTYTPNSDINQADHGNGYLSEYRRYWFGTKDRFEQSSFTHYYYLKNSD